MKKFAMIAAALCIGLSGFAQETAKDCCKQEAKKECSKKECCKAKNSGCTSKALDAKEAWATLYPQIEKSIKAPEFRDKDYKLFDYGKKSKTKGFLYTELINKVIDLCSSEGGGRVVIPKGTWLTGPITLKSNVNLHLEEGATLLFTDDTSQYPLVKTRWEGMDCYNY